VRINEVLTVSSSTVDAGLLAPYWNEEVQLQVPGSRSSLVLISRSCGKHSTSNDLFGEDRMNSVSLKEVALWWLKFEKRMTHICTEFGTFNSDVYGACETRSMEIETKVSMSDLRYDFEKRKHHIYANPANCAGHYPSMHIPNYFFFLVPQKLAEQAISLCDEKGPKYGVLVYDPLEESWRRPRRIHKEVPHKDVFARMAARMSNEIIATHMWKSKIESSRDWISNTLENRLKNKNLEETTDDGLGDDTLVSDVCVTDNHISDSNTSDAENL
jgi:hypothetical protein